MVLLCGVVVLLCGVVVLLCIYYRERQKIAALNAGFYNPDEKCLQRGTDWVFK